MVWKATVGIRSERNEECGARCRSAVMTLLRCRTHPPRFLAKLGMDSASLTGPAKNPADPHFPFSILNFQFFVRLVPHLREPVPRHLRQRLGRVMGRVVEKRQPRVRDVLEIENVQCCRILIEPVPIAPRIEPEK